MKREDISEAISNINEKYIEEAEEFQLMKKAKKPAWLKWVPMAACLCLIAVGITTFALFKVAHPWPVKFVRMPGAPGVEVPFIGEPIPRWEDRPIYGQYSTVEWNGTGYDSRSAELPAERIGEFLGDVTAKGWDDYAEMKGENGERQISAKVYAVTKISAECMVAVQYEGTDTWYAFWNSYYKPQTLGQLMQDLNLYEEVVFDTIHYSFHNAFGDHVSVRFENVDDQIIRSWLLSDVEAKEVYDQMELYEQPRRIMGISVDIPILGIENISLSVQEAGYIKTNIVSTGALFYIGEENTQGFVDYVLNQCEGYETIYLYEERGVPESKTESPVERDFEGAGSPSVSG